LKRERKYVILLSKLIVTLFPLFYVEGGELETFFIIITKSESAISTEFATSGEEVGFVFQSALNGTIAIISKEAFVYMLADTP